MKGLLNLELSSTRTFASGVILLIFTPARPVS
jgi:hypothetical protein